MYGKLRDFSKALKREFQIYRLVLKDKRTPLLAKVLLGLAVGYIMMPFDLIPDFIPILGHVDDVILVPLLVKLALMMIPEEIIAEYRRAV